jgi:hypothetical protein
VAGGRKGMHNEELRNSHASPNIVTVIKSRRMRSADYEKQTVTAPPQSSDSE